MVRGKAPWVEQQHPDCAVLLFPAGSEPKVDYGAMGAALRRFDGLEWVGKANALSKDHVVWDVIYRTAEAVKKHGPAPEESFSVSPWQRNASLSDGIYKELTVQEVVRRRRSAVDMDGVPKGMYFLVRNEEHFDTLQRAMKQDFDWERPDGCPDGLPLYRLMKGDCQRLSMQISCFQDIASHGCFSIGMIARFEPVLREKGEWMYPRLFWETGVLGQVLYLEAHAVGISATGIGCYFDDAVHEVLGLKDLEFQSLYHFTVGAPVLDKRIMSLPAYPGPGIDA
uniref:Nitroreductase domain-containing protein n=2 Tax=Oryza brachyantha TaxID=4533 RepID=J3N1G0_ORYBR